MAGGMTVLGVLSDTHIPDRAARLNPRVFEIFRRAEVKAILHAGDISVPGVLQELEGVAPVHAVRGNRDIFYLRNLPLRIELNIHGVSIGMAHGHGTFSQYMLDRVQSVVRENLDERYFKRMLLAFPGADVIVFGHLHVPCNMPVEGKLLFNPGSASVPRWAATPPTIGLLYIEEGEKPYGELITLEPN
jgi:putative phosphoesterase